MTRRLAIVILAALAVPSAAWAHATLVRTDPANGSVLARPPVAVRVVFDDTVQVGPGVEAIRNGGGSVLVGRPRVNSGRTLVVPVRRGLAEGAYSVRWSIISDDGHLESGVLAFAVGAGQLPPTSRALGGVDAAESRSCRLALAFPRRPARRRRHRSLRARRARAW